MQIGKYKSEYTNWKRYIGKYKSGKYKSGIHIENTTRMIQYGKSSPENTNPKLQAEQIQTEEYKSETIHRENREIQIGNTSRKNTSRGINFGKYKSEKTSREIQLGEYDL